jgi:hypothetical protein
MVISYALIAAVGYYYVGATVGSPITSELPSIGAANVVVNVLLFCHVTVAYVEKSLLIIKRKYIHLHLNIFTLRPDTWHRNSH